MMNSNNEETMFLVVSKNSRRDNRCHTHQGRVGRVDLVEVSACSPVARRLETAWGSV